MQPAFFYYNTLVSVVNKNGEWESNVSNTIIHIIQNHFIQQKYV